MKQEHPRDAEELGGMIAAALDRAHRNRRGIIWISLAALLIIVVFMIAVFTG